MSTSSNALPESFGSQAPAPAALSTTRQIYWSLRREFWENRYLYIGPLAVAAVFLFGFLISLIHAPGQMRALVMIDQTHSHDDFSGPFDLASALMMGIAILLSVFYCSEALHGERRDRSILFWKSLPVSDTTTVLVKASIPLLILPVLIFAIAALLQLLMLMLSSAVVMGSGSEVGALWAHAPVWQMSLLLLYHLITVHALWPAPVYCWLMLASGWARRAAFLWAALPIAALGSLEKIAFGTSRFAKMVGNRILGSTAPAAANTPNVFPTNPMTHLTPGEFLATPGLWVGLLVAALFLAAAIRLRRYRGPI